MEVDLLTDEKPRWWVQHKELYLRDPVGAHDWDMGPIGGTGLGPTLLLSTVGRNSKLLRATPLLYQPRGTEFIVIASGLGFRQPPYWSCNLLSNPNCVLQAGRFNYTARAHIAEGAERRSVLETMMRVFPDHPGLFQAQEHEPKLFVLTPVG